MADDPIALDAKGRPRPRLDFARVACELREATELSNRLSAGAVSVAVDAAFAHFCCNDWFKGGFDADIHSYAIEAAEALAALEPKP
jgi:hypothetical protein